MDSATSALLYRASTAAPLRKELRTEVARRTVEGAWPKTTWLLCPSCGVRLEHQLYIKRLVELALLEVQCPEQFALVKAKWDWLGCSDIRNERFEELKVVAGKLVKKRPVFR